MKILIVEDDIGIAELITDALDSVSENISVVHNGKDAVGFVIDHKPDLMVLDYSLPDMNASGIIEKLKAKNTEIPTFIISTGQGDERIAVEMMKLGAHDCIVKDTYLLNRIPSVVERALEDIRKDRKLKSAMEAMRLSDQKLLEERRRLANIIKASNVGTWEWNLKTNETVFNHRWGEIVGYSIEELTPLTFDTWMNMVHPEDIQKTDRAIKDHISGKKDYYEMELRMHHKNNKWVWVLTRGGITEWDEKGEPLILSGTHQDITDKKNSEQLEKEIQIAQEALQFKQNFLANMSHEIRTPLTGILGMAEMLEKQLTSNDQKDYLNTLKKLCTIAYRNH
ncbi:MAG: PAS domain-containing protein [Bacteroidota bacterium]